MIEDRQHNITFVTILGLSLIICSGILSMGIAKLGEARSPSTSTLGYQLFGYRGVIYRLDKMAGRTDVLYPGEDGAVYLPLWQMNPSAGDISKMSEEDQKKWNNISKNIAEYLLARK